MQLFATLKALGKPKEFQFDPTKNMQMVIIEALGGVVLKQCHGDVVQVPPGWAHSVLNRSPAFKIAWETTQQDSVRCYPRIAQLIAQYFPQEEGKPEKANDYMPFHAMALNLMDRPKSDNTNASIVVS